MALPDRGVSPTAATHDSRRGKPCVRECVVPRTAFHTLRQDQEDEEHHHCLRHFRSPACNETGCGARFSHFDYHKMQRSAHREDSVDTLGMSGRPLADAVSVF